MNKKVLLNSESLLNIKFSPNVKGYDPLEVDKILDEIIKDYQTFEELLKTSNEKSASQEKEIADLKSDIRKVELELAEIKKHISTVPDGKNISQDNLKLLKKISVYENALWKKGINPNKLTSGSDNC